MFGTFGVLIIVCAIYVRARGAAAFGQDHRHKPLFIWFLPAAITVTMLPVIMAGGLDPEIAYVCLGLAILVALKVVWPMELLGRGLLRVVTGKPDGGPLVLLWLCRGAAIAVAGIVLAAAMAGRKLEEVATAG